MGDFKFLAPLMQSFMKEKTGPSGCALKVALGDEIIYEHYSGFADLKSTRPISAYTLYRIYSMTKVMTCTAALMLWERGLYRLNEPISDFLPAFTHMSVYECDWAGNKIIRPAKSQITVKQLFNMTSGIVYDNEGCLSALDVAALQKEMSARGKYSTREFADALATIPLAFDPGTRWMYGHSHDVLAALAEAISGMHFGEFLKKEIFEPLDMKDTFFRIPENKKYRLAELVDVSSGEKCTGTYELSKMFQADYDDDALIEAGGAGLVSSIDDCLKFAKALSCGTQLLSRGTIDLMRQNTLSGQPLQDFTFERRPGYGYGLGVRTMIDLAAGECNGSLGEFGWGGAAGTWYLMDPEKKLSAVYMQQVTPNLSAPFYQLRLRNAIYGALK